MQQQESRFTQFAKERQKGLEAARPYVDALNEFLSSHKFPAAQVAELIAGLKADIVEPYSIHQGDTPWSMPALLANKIAVSEPEKYARFVSEMLTQGKTDIGFSQDMYFFPTFFSVDPDGPEKVIPRRTLSSLIFQSAVIQYVFGYFHTDEKMVYEFDPQLNIVVNRLERAVYSGFSPLQVQNIFHRFLFKGSLRLDTDKVQGGVPAENLIPEMSKHLGQGKTLTVEVSADNGPLTQLIEVVGMDEDRVWFYNPGNVPLFGNKLDVEIVGSMGTILITPRDVFTRSLVSLYLETGAGGLFAPLTPAPERECLYAEFDEEGFPNRAKNIRLTKIKDWEVKPLSATIFQAFPVAHGLSEERAI